MMHLLQKGLFRLSVGFVCALLLFPLLFTTVAVANSDGPETGGFTFENPIAANSIGELFLALLRIVMIVAVPIVIFFIVYAGFKYVTARGNAEEIQTATRALTYAIIGGVIIIGAMVIVEIVTNLVDAFRND